MVVKPRKANSNADFLSRQRGQEVVEDISAEFLDEFLEIGTLEPEEVTVFHINGGGESEFLEISRGVHMIGEDFVPTQGSSLYIDSRNFI